jgi:hypothetical protein
LVGGVPESVFEVFEVVVGIGSLFGRVFPAIYGQGYRKKG